KRSLRRKPIGHWRSSKSSRDLTSPRAPRSPRILDNSQDHQTPGKALKMADTVNVERPSGVSVRAFSHGEESALLNILSNAFGSFADVPRTKAVLSSRRFDADGCFIAEENGLPAGWVTATRLPRDNWFVIRYLSVKQAMLRTDITETMLDRASKYENSKA